MEGFSFPKGENLGCLGKSKFVLGGARKPCQFIFPISEKVPVT